MGRWGVEIYQSDDALDFRDNLEDKLVRIIVTFLADEALTGWPPLDGNGYVAAAADILALWGEHYGNLSCVTTKVVRHWRVLALKQLEVNSDWDDTQTAEGLDARMERRKVIEATFDRLEAVAPAEN